MPRDVEQQETPSGVDEEHIVPCSTESSVPSLKPQKSLCQFQIRKINDDSAVLGEQHTSVDKKSFLKAHIKFNGMCAEVDVEEGVGVFGGYFVELE